MHECPYCKSDAGYMFKERNGARTFSGEWGGPFTCNYGDENDRPNGTPKLVTCANDECARRSPFVLACKWPEAVTRDEPVK